MIELNTNWRDPKTYEHINPPHLKRWAWEFIRRNPVYWEYWRESSKLYEKELNEAIQAREERKKENSLYDRIAPIGFDLLVPALTAKRTKKLGTPDPTPPAPIDFHLSDSNLHKDDPNFYIIRWSAEGVWGFNTLQSPEQNNPLFFGNNNVRVYSKAEERIITFPADNVVVRFNLAKDIEAQMKNAKSQLEKLQALRNIKPLKPKLRKNEWKLYLRILDAANSRTPRQISAPIIFPKLDVESAKDSYSNALKRAKVIMERGYRNWL